MISSLAPIGDLLIRRVTAAIIPSATTLTYVSRNWLGVNDDMSSSKDEATISSSSERQAAASITLVVDDIQLKTVKNKLHSLFLNVINSLILLRGPMLNYIAARCCLRQDHKEGSRKPLKKFRGPSSKMFMGPWFISTFSGPEIHKNYSNLIDRQTTSHNE